MKTLFSIFLFFFAFSLSSQEVRLEGDWEYKAGEEDSEWQKCKLPNDIYTLIQNTAIADKDLNWLHKTKFYFRKKVEIPFEFLDHPSTKLVLKNVDTYCRVLIKQVSLAYKINVSRISSGALEPDD